MNRKEIFADEEMYHIYNRGNDKREIFGDMSDVSRFMDSLLFFNTVTAYGGMSPYQDYQNVRAEHDNDSPLVEVLAYCLLPNHFHLLLRQIQPSGISQFMQRLGGYTYYFNKKYKRSGSLFQGKFKAKHIDSDSYLSHVAAYIHANDYVHQFKGWRIGEKTTAISSLGEYLGTHPFVLCENFFNPLRETDEAFAAWSIDHAKKIRQERLEYPGVIE